MTSPCHGQGHEQRKKERPTILHRLQQKGALLEKAQGKGPGDTPVVGRWSFLLPCRHPCQHQGRILNLFNKKKGVFINIPSNVLLSVEVEGCSKVFSDLLCLKTILIAL